MKQLVRDCDCEDWPACVHADLVAGWTPEPDPYAEEPRQCSDYQDFPQSDCIAIDCPHYEECWGDESD